MNRLLLAVSLVGLLVIQGSVVGLIVSDSAVGNVSSRTDTTTDEGSSNDTVASSSDETTTGDDTLFSTEAESSVAKSVSFGTEATSERTGTNGGTGANVASPDAEFEVVSVSSDVPVGGIGNISVTIENTGEDATNAVVNLQSLSDDLLFGQSPNTSRFVGEWDEGENRIIEVQARAARTADTTEYPAQATASYEDDSGNSSQSAPLTFGVAPDGEQQFSLSGVEGDLRAGESGTISGTITNEGPKTATDAVLTFAPNGSRDVIPRQSQYVLGSLDPDESESFELPVAINSTAESGQRQVPLVVEYYDSNGNSVQSRTLTTRVDISDERDDFQVVSSSTDVQVGDTGTVSVALENTGANASEATVSLQSLSGDITFSGTANATQFIGEWPAGAQRTVTLTATASNQTDTRRYPFQASVSYNDVDGDQSRAGPFTVGVTPQPEQSFNISNTSSTLRVGDEGNITATVTNQGPQNASNAVVRLVTHGQNSNPQETEAAIGRLSAGESANVAFPMEISDSAEAGQRQFSVVVEYDNQNGDTRQSGTLDTQAAVAPQRDEFTVERANASVDVGSSGTVTLNVTNNRGTTVRNINVKAFVDDPLSTSTSEAYIVQLNPGESSQIAFDVSASGSASEGQYPLSVDFEYEAASGDSKLSQTYEVPISVAAAEDGGILPSLRVMVGLGVVIVLLGVLIVLLGVGWVWLRW